MTNNISRNSDVRFTLVFSEELHLNCAGKRQMSIMCEPHGITTIVVTCVLPHASRGTLLLACFSALRACLRSALAASRAARRALIQWIHTTTLIIKLQIDLFRFEYYVYGKTTPRFALAPAPCHIAGIFLPLPGSRNLKQKMQDSAYKRMLSVATGC